MKFFRFLFCLSALVGLPACEHSELWRHRQETADINARLPGKEQYLSSLQAEQSTLGQQQSSLSQQAQSANATLSDLNEQLRELDDRLEADRRSNRKLRYNLKSTTQRTQRLKVDLAKLQEQQRLAGSAGQENPEMAAQLQRKKEEVEALLKVVIQQ